MTPQIIAALSGAAITLLVAGGWVGYRLAVKNYAVQAYAAAKGMDTVTTATARQGAAAATAAPQVAAAATATAAHGKAAAGAAAGVNAHAGALARQGAAARTGSAAMGLLSRGIMGILRFTGWGLAATAVLTFAEKLLFAKDEAKELEAQLKNTVDAADFSDQAGIEEFIEKLREAGNFDAGKFGAQFSARLKKMGDEDVEGLHKKLKQMVEDGGSAEPALVAMLKEAEARLKEIERLASLGKTQSMEEITKKGKISDLAKEYMELAESGKSAEEALAGIGKAVDLRSTAGIGELLAGFRDLQGMMKVTGEQVEKDLVQRLTVQEFGVFRGAPLPEPVQITVSVPDPMARGLGADVGTCIVYSLHPQGRRAVLCVEAAPGEPLAWLEVDLLDDAQGQLHGEWVATVRVLRTGAQTLGDGEYTVSTTPGRSMLVYFTDGSAAVPMSIVVRAAADAPLGSTLIGDGGGERRTQTTARWANMALSLWYDDAGHLHGMTVDVNISVLSMRAGEYQDGYYQAREEGGGYEVISPFSLEVVDTTEADWEVDVRVDGASVSRKVWSARGSSSYLTQAPDGSLFHFSGEWEDSVFANDDWIGSSVSYSGSESSTYPVILGPGLFRMYPDINLAHLTIPVLSSLHDRYRIMTTVRLRTWNETRGPTEPGRGELPSVWPGLCCYGHAAWGWVQCPRTAVSAGYLVNFLPTGEVVTRDGIAVLQIVIWSATISTSAYNLYGHRFTGAPYVARSPVTSEHRISRTPICWV